MPEWCHDQSCQVEYAGSLEEACSVGWGLVSEFTFCPLHMGPAGFVARREAKKEVMRAQIEAQQAHRNKEVALKHFSAAEYRAWDQFQSDLADYHKKTGKLAPAVLRTMRPMNWLGEYKEKGRIDIAKTAEYFEQAKVARGKRTIDRLKGL